MQKPQPVIPIVGARKTAQVEDNLNCLEFELSSDHIARLNEVSKIELGFPHNFLQKPAIKEVVFGGMYDQIVNHRR